MVSDEAASRKSPEQAISIPRSPRSSGSVTKEVWPRCIGRCPASLSQRISQKSLIVPHRAEQLIDDILESVILCLHAEPVVPCKGVADDETAEYIVRTKDTDDP